jgi:cation:H+ antiporter
MEILKEIVIIAVCIYVIGRGAVWLIDAAVNVAGRLGISNLVIGLTVVAIGTSAPEFGVTLDAALRGMSDISVGNIVGSNIFNLGFILGGTTIVRTLKTNRTVILRDAMFLLFGTILLTMFLWDLSLNHVEGILLFVLLVAYLWYLYWKKEPLDPEAQAGRFRKRDPFFLVLGLGMVLGGSHYLVNAGVRLAVIVGISEWVIGATIVAAGTSAPEFATSLVAAIRGQYGISVGNLVGSNIFNTFGVLGLAGILRNLPVDVAARENMIALAIMVVIVMFFMRTKWQITRMEGFVLVVLALMLWVFSFT